MIDVEYDYASTIEENHQAAEAEPIFRDLLASYTRVDGPNHIDTLMAQQGVAHNLYKQKRYREAAIAALPAAEGLSRVAGEDHQWTQTAWGAYGIAACLSGDGDAGLSALRRLDALRLASSGATDLRKLATAVKIGTCLVALQRYSEAEPLLLQTVAALESIKGASVYSTQDGYKALRDLYAQQGRPADAARWEAKVLPRNR